MGLADSNPSSGRIEKPYIVCDRCGHLWSVWAEPTACGDCGSKALWFFLTPSAALDRSREIRQ